MSSSPTPSLSSVDLRASSELPLPAMPSSSSSPRIRNLAATGDLSGRKVKKEENLFEVSIISSSSIITFLAIAAIGAVLTVLAVHGIGAPYTKIGAYAVWSIEGLSIFAVFTASIVKFCEKRSRGNALLSGPDSPPSDPGSPVSRHSSPVPRDSAILASGSESELLFDLPEDSVETLLRWAPSVPGSDPFFQPAPGRITQIEALPESPLPVAMAVPVPRFEEDAETLPVEEGSSSDSPVSDSHELPASTHELTPPLLATSVVETGTISSKIDPKKESAAN